MQFLVLCAGCGADNRVDEGRAKQEAPVCGRCQKALDLRAPGHTLVATDTTFGQDVLQSGVPTLVDFWAEWCGPCQAFEPTLKEFARQTVGQVRVVKVNVDAARNIAAQYGIRSIPTLVLFRGREVARRSGAAPLEQLRRFVAQHGGAVV